MLVKWTGIAIFVLGLCQGLGLASAQTVSQNTYYPGVEFMAADGSILIEDGDSLWIGIHRVRLMGIDTPETNQPCEGSGQSVDCHSLTMQFVEPLFKDESLVCKLHMGKFGKPLMDGARYISTCFVNGKELNRHLVESGYAVAYGPKTSDVYEKAETLAKARKLGLHKYTFEKPIDFRRRGSAPACPAP